MKRHKYPYEAQMEINDLERKLEAMEELCYEFYSAGLSAGHPMTTAQTIERDYSELKEELDQLKEK